MCVTICIWWIKLFLIPIQIKGPSLKYVWIKLDLHVNVLCHQHAKVFISTVLWMKAYILELRPVTRAEPAANATVAEVHVHVVNIDAVNTWLPLLARPPAARDSDWPTWLPKTTTYMNCVTSLTLRASTTCSLCVLIAYIFDEVGTVSVLRTYIAP